MTARKKLEATGKLNFVKVLMANLLQGELTVQTAALRFITRVLACSGLAEKEEFLKVFENEHAITPVLKVCI